MAEESLPQQLLGRVRGQLAMLVAQFVIGMAVNLIGDPEGRLARATKGLLLGLHVLIAIGLAVGVALTMKLALKLGGSHLRLARGAGAGVGVALIAGILTYLKVAPGADWWSYLMALGFIAATIVYAWLYAQILLQRK